MASSDSRHVSKRQGECSKISNCIFDSSKFFNSKGQVATVFDLAVDSRLFNKYCENAEKGMKCFKDIVASCRDQKIVKNIEEQIFGYKYLCSENGRPVINNISSSTCIGNREAQETVIHDCQRCNKELNSYSFEKLPTISRRDGKGTYNYTATCNGVNKWYQCSITAASGCGNAFVAYLRETLNRYKETVIWDVVKHC